VVDAAQCEWIALSDMQRALNPSVGPLLAEGQFILEFEAARNEPMVLLDYHVTRNWPRAFSVFADRQAGIILLHRQGDRLLRHVLPGPLQMDGAGIARLVYDWDGPGRGWTLKLELPETGLVRETRGRNPMPLHLEDLLAICATEGNVRRHSSVLWFGVRNGPALSERSPWIGPTTLIETVAGPLPANLLRAGDMIRVGEEAFRPLISVHHSELPARGSFSPVLLRAPYFGAPEDILVSASQLVALSGPEVEYLFGEDEVLAEAGHLIDGRAALHDPRRAVTSCVMLDIGEALTISADGCGLLCHQISRTDPARTPPRRILHAFEAVPLALAPQKVKSGRAA
jgi:hypothetical protein